MFLMRAFQPAQQQNGFHSRLDTSALVSYCNSPTTRNQAHDSRCVLPLMLKNTNKQSLWHHGNPLLLSGVFLTLGLDLDSVSGQRPMSLYLAE